MDNWQKRLIAMFLKELAERMGNDGRNDWECPDWVPVDSFQDFMLKHPDVDGDIAEASALSGYNHFVVDALADALLGELGNG